MISKLRAVRNDGESAPNAMNSRTKSIRVVFFRTARSNQT